MLPSVLVLAGTAAQAQEVPVTELTRGDVTILVSELITDAGKYKLSY